MNDTHACASDRELLEQQGAVRCADCDKEIDYLASLVSASPQDAIYICFESIKQKIFVYGKYLGGKYGALQIKKYYTRNECDRKLCEDDMRALLEKENSEEYSRLVTCKKGNMESVILTRDIIEARRRDLMSGLLREFFTSPDGVRKYYCHEHAARRGFTCRCGAELLQLGSEKHRDRTGMDDQKFVETYLRRILSF